MSKERNQAQKRPSGGRGRSGGGPRTPLVFGLMIAVLLILFLGRWVTAINQGYFASFVQLDPSVEQAAAKMTGLTPSEEEKALLLPLQREWDLFTAARLRDEVTVTARDGAVLHGYLYDEGSDVTVVVIPRFYQDGTADFLPGPWLQESLGCNLLLIDPRAHGGSGGDYFGYGWLEQEDLACWLEWADGALGPQSFLLWGEGTGANTILFAAASGLLSDQVVCAVAESPYPSLHELAAEQLWNWYRIPAFPFLSILEHTLANSPAGYTVDDADLGAALEGSSAGLPVLFLQTAGDAYILPAWSQQVYELYPGPKEQLSGPGSHGMGYAQCREQVQQLLLQWWSEAGF